MKERANGDTGLNESYSDVDFVKLCLPPESYESGRPDDPFFDYCRDGALIVLVPLLLIALLPFAAIGWLASKWGNR